MAGKVTRHLDLQSITNKNSLFNSARDLRGMGLSHKLTRTR